MPLSSAVPLRIVRLSPPGKRTMLLSKMGAGVQQMTSGGIGGGQLPRRRLPLCELSSLLRRSLGWCAGLAGPRGRRCLAFMSGASWRCRGWASLRSTRKTQGRVSAPRWQSKSGRHSASSAAGLALRTHSSLLNTHYSLLTTHCSRLYPYSILLTTHYLLLTPYCLPLTTYSSLHIAYLYCLLLTPYYLIITPYCLLCTAHDLLLAAYCLLLTPYCSLLTTYSSLLTAYYVLLTNYHLLLTVYS